MRPNSFYKNPDLPTLSVSGWRGNPTDEHGRFFNPDYPFIPALSDHLRWSLTLNSKRAEKRRDRWSVPVVQDFSFQKSRDAENVLIWLGHASFYLRLAGVSMLIDPMFHGFPGLPRYSTLPLFPEDFANIDLVLISHNHRDHCDRRSLQEIGRRFPSAHFLTGLGTDVLLKKWLKNAAVQAAGWYQQFDTGSARIQVFYLPARHWTRRWVTDTNYHLWGAFLIKTPGHTLYFSGDTGYGRHFADTAALFPDIDTAIMGIGTYQPSFDSPMHIDPENAVRGFRDLRAHTLVPMHFGTFDLSHEPFSEPLRRLEAAISPAQGLQLLAVGENCFLPKTKEKPGENQLSLNPSRTFYSNN